MPKKGLILFLILIFSVTGFLHGCALKKESPPFKEKKPEKKGEIIMYTTTSLYDSGLLETLLPPFEKKYNVTVKTIAVGTGEALKNAEQGNVDAIFVHDPEREQEYVERRVLLERTPIAKNYFLIVGPKDDPAEVKEAENPAKAFEKIFKEKALFASRGDNSGTHSKELNIWSSAGIDPLKNSGYFETGQGMGETLRIASERQAYTLTDIATFFSTGNLELEVLFKEGSELENLYSFSLVNPDISSKINYRDAKKLLEYLRSDEAQEIIADFGRERTPAGWQLFEPVRNL